MNYAALVSRLFGRVPSTVTLAKLAESNSPHALALEAACPHLAEFGDAPRVIAQVGRGFVSVGQTHAILMDGSVAEIARIPEEEQEPVSSVRELLPVEQKNAREHIKHGRKEYRFGKFRPGMSVKWKDERWIVYDARARGGSKFTLMLVSPDYKRLADEVPPAEIGESETVGEASKRQDRPGVCLNHNGHVIAVWVARGGKKTVTVDGEPIEGSFDDLESALASGKAEIDESETVDEALQHGDHVRIHYKVVRTDIERAFQGKVGTISGEERDGRTKMFRVRFQPAVQVPGVDPVTSDLWAAEFLKKAYGESVDEARTSRTLLSMKHGKDTWALVASGPQFLVSRNGEEWDYEDGEISDGTETHKLPTHIAQKFDKIIAGERAERGYTRTNEAVSFSRKKFGGWSVRANRGVIWLDDENKKVSYYLSKKHGEFMAHREDAPSGAAGRLLSDMDLPADVTSFLATLGESIAEGEWRTTKSGHRIYIEKGKVTKGNPHVIGAVRAEPAADDSYGKPKQPVLNPTHGGPPDHSYRKEASVPAGFLKANGLKEQPVPKKGKPIGWKRTPDGPEVIGYASKGKQVFALVKTPGSDKIGMLTAGKVKESVDEAFVNHRNYAAAGMVHKSFVKGLKAGQEVDFYEPGTGDKLNGRVVALGATEIVFQEPVDGRWSKDGKIHRLRVTDKPLSESESIDEARGVPHWRTLVDELIELAGEIDTETEVSLEVWRGNWNLQVGPGKPQAGRKSAWAEGTIDPGLTMDDAREVAKDMLDQIKGDRQHDESLDEAKASDQWSFWADWTPHERIVFNATVTLKPGYGGDKDFRFNEAARKTGITRDQWDTAAASLKSRGVFNASGAVKPDIKKRYYAERREMHPSVSQGVAPMDAWEDVEERTTGANVGGWRLASSVSGVTVRSPGGETFHVVLDGDDFAVTDGAGKELSLSKLPGYVIRAIEKMLGVTAESLDEADQLPKSSHKGKPWDDVVAMGKGGYVVKIWRGQRTKWAYSTTNPQGGGFSTTVETQNVMAVLAKALNINDKPKRVWVVVGARKPTDPFDPFEVATAFWFDTEKNLPESVAESREDALKHNYTEALARSSGVNRCSTCVHGRPVGGANVQCERFNFRAKAYGHCSEYESEPVEKDESIDEAKSVPPIDSPIYRDVAKLPKYNVKVSPLSAHGSDGGKLLARRLPDWTKADHLAAAAEHEKLAADMDKQWGVEANAAAQSAWGRDYKASDYRISGIASDEFDSKHKDELRRLAHTASAHKDAAHAHKMAARMRSLAKEDLDAPVSESTYYLIRRDDGKFLNGNDWEDEDPGFGFRDMATARKAAQDDVIRGKLRKGKFQIVSRDTDEVDEAALSAPLFSREDSHDFIEALRAGIEAPFVQVSRGPLWGSGSHPSVHVTISVDPKESWVNGIMQNSRYAMFSIAPSGEVEKFSGGYKTAKFRKTKANSAQAVAAKLNAWVKASSTFESADVVQVDSFKDFQHDRTPIDPDSLQARASLGEFGQIDEGYQHVHFEGSKSARARTALAGGKTKSVQGRTFDGMLLVHPTGNYQWGVTHISTGLGLVPYPGFADDREAVKFAKAASALGGWDFTDPTTMPEGLPDKMKTLLAAFRPHIRKTGGNASESVDESATAVKKLAALRAGKVVAVGDDLLGEIEELVSSSEQLRSLPNPKQAGTKDTYVAWIGPDRAKAPVANESVDEMARLSAGGRVELLRVSKEVTTPDDESIDWRRVTRAWMDDGKVLEKSDVNFKAWGEGKARKHSYGWKVTGKIKPDLLSDPAKLSAALASTRAKLESSGWTVETFAPPQ